MVAFLTLILEALAILFTLRLAVEQGEFLTGWLFGWLWRGIELATHGAVGSKPKLGIGRLPRRIAGKIAGWIWFAITTIAQPFVVIIGSMLPEDDDEEAPEQAEDTAEEQPQAKAEQPRPGPDLSKDAAYKRACDLLALPVDCTHLAASKAWARAIKTAHPDNGGPTDMAQAVNAAWQLICERRGWRK